MKKVMTALAKMVAVFGIMAVSSFAYGACRYSSLLYYP